MEFSIKWPNSKELVEIVIDEKTLTGTSIKTADVFSTEFWNSRVGGGRTEYVNLKASVSAKGGIISVCVEYRDDNDPSGEVDVGPGKAELSFKIPNSQYIDVDKIKCVGRASYSSIDEEKDQFGPNWKNRYVGIKCTRIGTKFLSQANVVLRPGQALLRHQLIMARKVCVITGESNPEVLDLAHLVPYKLNPSMRRNDVVLMRADIHRLYDRGYFAIHDGKIVQGEKKIPESYRSLFVFGSPIRRQALRIAK